MRCVLRGGPPLRKGYLQEPYSFVVESISHWPRAVSVNCCSGVLDFCVLWVFIDGRETCMVLTCLVSLGSVWAWNTNTTPGCKHSS